MLFFFKKQQQQAKCYLQQRKLPDSDITANTGIGPVLFDIRTTKRNLIASTSTSQAGRSHPKGVVFSSNCFHEIVSVQGLWGGYCRLKPYRPDAVLLETFNNFQSECVFVCNKARNTASLASSWNNLTYDLESIDADSCFRASMDYSMVVDCSY